MFSTFVPMFSTLVPMFSTLIHMFNTIVPVFSALVPIFSTLQYLCLADPRRQRRAGGRERRPRRASVDWMVYAHEKGVDTVPGRQERRSSHQ